MDLSIYLARVWGLYVLIVCMGMLINRKGFIDLLKTMKNDISILVAGALALGLGVAQVVAYENWSIGWQGLITVFGWASLVKGAAVLFMPGYMETLGKTFGKNNWYTISLVVGAILGVYLTYIGFTR